MSKLIYMDHAATTAPAPEVVEEMMFYLEECWGNPSSLHAKGRDAGAAIADARARIASHIGAASEEVFFTASGTEADNWAIRGVLKMSKKKHIVTSVIEHPAVLNTCRALEKEGCTVTYVGVDEDGVVKMDELAAAVTDETALVCVMLANNEIGTIEPIREIAEIAHKHGAYMMTDAVQAVGSIPVDVVELGVDLLAFSGHKLYAPKGIGALYIKKGTRVANLIDGGGQERRRRGGTENVPYIMALAKALDLACDTMAEESARICAMRDRLIDELTKVPYTRLNGHRTNRLPGNVNISFEFVEGESILYLLDMQGICVSTGSACSSASLEPSHVLLSIGLPHEKAHGSIRFSLGRENTMEDVERVIETVPEVMNTLRRMSPIYPG